MSLADLLRPYGRTSLHVLLAFHARPKPLPLVRVPART